MKTFQTQQLLDENQMVKQLFQELFYFQIEFERISQVSDFPCEKVEVITQTIDQLLTLLMNHYCSED